MKAHRRNFLRRAAQVGLVALGLLAAATAQAAEFTLNVVDGDGNPVSGFRWVLQNDTTFPVDPNIPATNADDMLSLSFHASNQPVAKSETLAEGLNGNSDTDTATVSDVPAGRYYVSVLPYSGYSISGESVDLSAGDAEVKVTVQQHPIPTAQIAIFLFQDNWPVNGAPDLPEEENPGADGELVDWSQFNIILEEPAGRYGAAGGQVIADAFGNPLGTTYLDGCDPYTPECVDVPGDGTIQPDPLTGTVLIKNLAPGKYGVIVNPPTGENWQQTSTIEGTKVIDAWVKANEPPFFVEFGFPGPHVFVGFIRPFNDVSGGAADISGMVTDIHMSRPPNFQFFSGRPFPQCWVALNEGGAVPGQALFAGPCDGNSNFLIPDVPEGNYTLTIFDANLDVVIASQPLTIDAAGGCNGAADCTLGEVGVFNWFTRLNTSVFSDANQNGFWDADEAPAPAESGPVQVRWRDGTIYQVFGTDTEGFAPFDEVFPFFHWLVAEVGYARNKVTGATFVVDAGGFVDKNADAFPGFGELTPQEQCTEVLDTGECIDPIININTGDNLSRTELGPVLTQAFQGFLGQVSVMQFGTTPYVLDTLSLDPPIFPPEFVGENGGISGMALYATTRAEDDPELAAAEEWEPGVPRVQVALYADGDIDCPLQGNFPLDDCDIDWNGDGIRDPNDGIVDDVNRNGTIDLADVDNYPFGWSEGGTMGPEDVENSGAAGVFDYGDAINVTWTDSWDDSLPTGCQGQNNVADVSVVDPPVTNDRCFDGLRNFNQVRPGVFDGGWAFDSYDLAMLPVDIQDKLNAFYADRIALVGDSDTGVEIIQILPDEWMIPGEYIVEAATPPGYKLMREHHKNVDFGDEYVPSPEAFPAPCVGDLTVVPEILAMATMDGSGDLAEIIPGIDPVEAAAPFALEERELCDRKLVVLSNGANAAADFYLMTDVPIAANVSGMILDDLANEFNPNSPAFGEKYAPPFLPVGFYDWNGAQVNRVYADQYGRYNALLPSTWTANLPQPSGMSPNMIVSCKNDAGPIPNPDYDPIDNPDVPELIVDPFFDPRYSQFCYTFQYMPGAITYLDTPVESIAAFANPPEFPVDCERPDTTPMIASVTRDDGTGPYVVRANGVAAQAIEVRSLGVVTVPNPEWDGVDQATRTIERDYSFLPGEKEVILLAEDGITEYQLDNIGPSTEELLTRLVQDDVPPGAYQVIVENVSGAANGTRTPTGVTLTVGVEDGGVEKVVLPDGSLGDVHRVAGPALYPATPIQDAIDAASPGDLILVPPGAYDELVIMWKPVKLQGWGAGVVFINGRQVPTEKIDNWRIKIEQLVADELIDPLPGQDLPLPGFPALGAAIFATEEGAGIFVVGKEDGPDRFRATANRGSRIDGFTIVGASQGGAIVANGYTGDLNISNNRMEANSGFFGGGIRLGHPTLTFEDPDLGLIYPDATNDRIRVHHNHISQNGNTFGGAGAGLSIHTGADRYRVQENWICGNKSQGDGAGIGHLGLSNNGVIEDNLIIFNESFLQAGPVHGSGIFIGGKPGLQPLVVGDVPLILSPGAGNITIDANLIRGNLAGAGDGGGIRIHQVNGLDIANSLGDSDAWYEVRVFNNMINNNVAGLAGGGLSVEDSLSIRFRQNTVANNDSTATTALAFDVDPNQSVPQPAGIVSRVHSTDVALLMTAVTDTVPTDWLSFSQPFMWDNIVYQNRSFFWLNYDDPDTAIIETGLYPASCIATAPNGCDLANVDAYTVDFGVLNGLLDTGDLLEPRHSLLTDTTGYGLTNIMGDPDFLNPYFNGSRDSLNIPEFTTLQTAGAFDEGGNFIQVTYGPLTLVDPDGPTPLFDYHIGAASAAIDAGSDTGSGRLLLDFDNDARPTVDNDIGADERVEP